jgi:hypothetical protein
MACTVARRSLAKCPKSLQKFGFCGLLAVIYAAKLGMPANQAQLRALFKEVKRICAMQPGKWKNAMPKRQGGISFEHTLCLLRHYNNCKFHEVHRATVGKMTLATWLRTQTAPRTSYIVHLGTHAFYVHVASNTRKWTLYDQRGPQNRTDLASLTTKGGHGRKIVHRVLQIDDMVE